MKNKKWGFKINRKSILILIIGIAVNLIGKYITHNISLPLWLDSIGTIYSAAMLGPIAGAVVGAVSNISYAIVLEPINLFYMVVNALIGIYVGLFYKKDNNDLFQTLLTAMAISAITIVICVPLNMFAYHGYVGNAWGNALIDMLQNTGTLSGNISIVYSFLGEVFVDFPDKVLSMFIANGLVILNHRIYRGIQHTIQDKQAKSIKN